MGTVCVSGGREGREGRMDPRLGNPRAPIIRHITMLFDLFTTFPLLSDFRVNNQESRDE